MNLTDRHTDTQTDFFHWLILGPIGLKRTKKKFEVDRRKSQTEAVCHNAPSGAQPYKKHLQSRIACLPQKIIMTVCKYFKKSVFSRRSNCHTFIVRKSRLYWREAAWYAIHDQAFSSYLLKRCWS